MRVWMPLFAALGLILACARQKEPDAAVTASPSAAEPPPPAADKQAETPQAPPPAPAAEPAPSETHAVAPEKRDGARYRQAPKRAEESESDDFTSLAQAEAAFTKAQAEVDRLVLARNDLVRDQRNKAAPAARGSGGAARPSPRDADEAAEGKGGVADTCETTCKAWSSLLRAKSAICRMDQSGTRCTRAENVVRDAKPRVEPCGCQ